MEVRHPRGNAGQAAVGWAPYRARVATWADVERVGLSLPETWSGDSHGGEPVVLVRTQQFARFRYFGEFKQSSAVLADALEALLTKMVRP